MDNCSQAEWVDVTQFNFFIQPAQSLTKFHHNGRLIFVSNFAGYFIEPVNKGMDVKDKLKKICELQSK